MEFQHFLNIEPSFNCLLPKLGKQFSEETYEDFKVI